MIFKKLLGKRDEYLDWETYKDRINFLDKFNWQQNIRKNNLK